MGQTECNTPIMWRFIPQNRFDTLPAWTLLTPLFDTLYHGQAPSTATAYMMCSSAALQVQVKWTRSNTTRESSDVSDFDCQLEASHWSSRATWRTALLTRPASWSLLILPQNVPTLLEADFFKRHISESVTGFWEAVGDAEEWLWDSIVCHGSIFPSVFWGAT